LDKALRQTQEYESIQETLPTKVTWLRMKKAICQQILSIRVDKRDRLFSQLLDMHGVSNIW
jgi:hypothetical protein